MKRARLIERCERLRADITARGLATASEIEDVWPDESAREIATSEQDEDDKQEAWVTCLTNLVAFKHRQDWMATRSDEAERVALAALREEPIDLELTDGRTVEVHPKGLTALLWFEQADWLVAWLSARNEALREVLDSPAEAQSVVEDVGVPIPDLHSRIAAEIARQMAAIAAQACAPGPALRRPTELQPEPDFTPLDLVRIHRAFVQVNAARLVVLKQLVAPAKPGEAGKERMSWAVLYSTVADSMKTKAKLLADDSSLVSVLSQVQLSKRNAADDQMEDV